MPSSNLRLGEFLCFAVYSASHALARVYRPMLDVRGLTYPQYLVMTVLWEADGQTVGQIGGRLFLDSSTLTPLLKRLERTGRLRRGRDPADERVVRVHLTPQGLALRDRAEALPGCIAAASAMTADEIRRLKAGVEALRDALDRSSQGSSGPGTAPPPMGSPAPVPDGVSL